MSRDRIIGGLILVLSIICIIAYGWILFFSEFTILVLKVTAFIAVSGILSILAWIGYTLATTPPPKPIEEVEKELSRDSSGEQN